MYVPDNAESAGSSIESLMGQNEIIIERKRKQKKSRKGVESLSKNEVHRRDQHRFNELEFHSSVPKGSNSREHIAVELHRVGDRGLRLRSDDTSATIFNNVTFEIAHPICQYDIGC